METTPINTADFTRNVALDIVLTILLCGLWNMVVQYNQCRVMNYLLKEEKYNYWKFYIFTLLTCGIYYFYHEYTKAADFQKITGSNDTSEPILALVLSVLSFGFVYDAILQSKINDHFTKAPFHPGNP